MLLVDLLILGDVVGELVLENLLQVTVYTLPSFGDLLVSIPHRRSPCCW